LVGELAPGSQSVEFFVADGHIVAIVRDLRIRTSDGFTEKITTISELVVGADIQ